jgi:hypothetical protein
VIVGDRANPLNEVTQDRYQTKELTTVCRKFDPTPRFWIRISRLSPVEQEGLDISASNKWRKVESEIARSDVVGAFSTGHNRILE